MCAGRIKNTSTTWYQNAILNSTTPAFSEPETHLQDYIPKKLRWKMQLGTMCVLVELQTPPPHGIRLRIKLLPPTQPETHLQDYITKEDKMNYAFWYNVCVG